MRQSGAGDIYCIITQWANAPALPRPWGNSEAANNTVWARARGRRVTPFIHLLFTLAGCLCLAPFAAAERYRSFGESALWPKGPGVAAKALSTFDGRNRRRAPPYLWTEKTLSARGNHASFGSLIGSARTKKHFGRYALGL